MTGKDRLEGRPLGTSDAQAISAFFHWWATARPRIEAALAAEALDPLVEEISRRVEALAPGLGWEIGPALHGGAHAFALSAGGDLAARRVTELWRRAAPADAGGWELYPAKPGGGDLAGLALELEGESVSFGAMEVAVDVDERAERLDVRLFHPAFARLAPALARQLAELAIVETLGEDGRARWLGELDAARARPREARPLAALRAEADALAARATGERFAVLQGESGGRPAFALVNLACKAIDHLALDVHLRVEIAAAEAGDDGLPTADELKALDAIEEDLLGGLSEAGEGEGGREAARFFAHETGSGRRVIHFYAPAGGERGRAARAAVDEWREVHGDDRAITATWTADPTWEALSRFG